MDQAQASNDATGEGEPTPDQVYAYKPSLMGAAWEFRLQPDRLAWSIGRRAGSIPYRDIQTVRLSFRPVTMQSYRFIAEIWSPQAPKLTIASASWRGLMEQERLDRPYRDFIMALHRRIAGAAGQPKLEAGTNPYLYWPGLVIFVAIAVGVGVLLISSLLQGFFTASLFLVGFFLLLMWQIGGFFWRNRPRHYRADAVPDEILPKVKS